MCAQRQAETSSAIHFLEDPCCSRAATFNTGFLKDKSSVRNILQRLLQGCAPPRVCGSIRCSCSRVFTTSRPRPRNKLPCVGCRKCVLFSRFDFGRCVRATRFVRGRSTDGVLSPRVSVFHAPCLLYLLQHRESCSKLNTGDVISMFTSLFPVHMS